MFKKDLTLKISACFIVMVFMFNTMSYGVELPINEQLRIPLGFSSADSEKPDLDKRFNSELSRRSLLETYSIITVLRRMRHGGSVYDMDAHLNAVGLLHMIAEECPPDLGIKITAIYEKLDDAFSKLHVLVHTPSKEIEAGEISDKVIQDWESRLTEQLSAFKEVQTEFAGLKARISSESSDKETVEAMSAIFEDVAKEWVSILEQGVNFTKGIVVKKEVSLNDIIKEAIKPYSKLIEFKETPVPDIYADPMMVLQIITNIIVNADKLRDKAEITRLTINVRLSEDDKEVIIDIADNGLGFDKNMLSERQELDGSYEVMFGYGVTYRDGGSGFGLAENDLYAKIHNGNFRVFSRPFGENRGSSFIIRLPVMSQGAAAIRQITELQTSL